MWCPHSLLGLAAATRKLNFPKEVGAEAATGRSAKPQHLPAVREENEVEDVSPAVDTTLEAAAAGPMVVPPAVDDHDEEDTEALVAAATAAVRGFVRAKGGAHAGAVDAVGGQRQEVPLAPHSHAAPGTVAAKPALPVWSPGSRLPKPLTLRECETGGADERHAATKTTGQPAAPGSLLFHPPPEAQRQAARQAAKAAAAASAGPKWFDMKAPTMTEDVKRDLRLLRLRGVADPKRFYKKSDSGKLATHFAVGTVVETAADFYSGRMAKADRRQTLGEEMLADSHAGAYRKSKFTELQDAAQAAAPKRKFKRKPTGGGDTHKKARHETRRANV